MKKRTIIFVSIAVAVALLAGIWVYAAYYRNQDHADSLKGDELYEYNYLLTVFGRNNSLTGDNELLIVDSISKNLGGDTQVTFRIYHYEKESDLLPGLKMTREEIEKNASYEYVGFGEVTLVDDAFAGMSNMKTVYVK